MTNIRFLNIIAMLACIFVVACSAPSPQPTTQGTDPLEYWNEGAAKTAILNFVTAATDSASPNFIPVADRIATFDMDGTILLEKPNYVMFDFIGRLLKPKIEANPKLKNVQPCKAFIEKDMAYLASTDPYSEQGLWGLDLYATEGYTDKQFNDSLKNYFTTVTDERFGKPYNKLVYPPVVQLIKYLQEKQFDVYIVSGSDPYFTRSFCEEAANIPVKNVIGTTVLSKWVETDSTSYFVRTHEFSKPINDEAGKPVNILNKIGKVPVFACGNSTGDYHMLQFSKTTPFSIQLIVNHDDSVREYNYHAEKMKTLCEQKGWQEISMKNDFKLIFAD